MARTLDQTDTTTDTPTDPTASTTGDDGASTTTTDPTASTPVTSAGDGASTTTTDPTTSTTGDDTQTPVATGGDGTTATTDPQGTTGADTGQASDGGTSTDGSSDTPPDDIPVNQLVLSPIDPVAIAADPGFTPEQPAIAARDAVGNVIAVGTAISQIMKDSSPDYTMKGAPVSVIPQGAQPLDIVGFSADPHEVGRRIKYTYTAFTHEFLVIDLPIVVQWSYGGKYNGHGAFINNASVFLDSGADIGAFYKVNVTAALQGPANAGSVDEPVATVAVHIEINVEDKIGPTFLQVVLEGKISGDGSGELHERP